MTVVQRNFASSKIIGFDLETSPVPSICPECDASMQPTKHNRTHMNVTDALYDAMGQCPWCETGVLLSALPSDPNASPPIFSVDFAYMDGGDVKHETFVADAGESMTLEQLLEVVDYIEVNHNDGYVFAGANLVKFDFAHLAAQSGAYEVCSKAAMDCIDPTLLSFCHFGYPIGLDACAAGIGVDGKAHEINGISVSGAKAWELWCSGDPAKLNASILYLHQDTDVSLRVGIHWARTFTQTWKTAKGRVMNKGLHTVQAEGALRLNLPDTSWMKLEPGEVRPSRASYIEWITDFERGMTETG